MPALNPEVFRALDSQRQQATMASGGTRQPIRKKKGFWEDQISTGGGIAGALAGGAAGASIGSVVPIVGTAAGGILGALIGGATGGGGAQIAENVYTGEKDLFKDVGREALMNGVFGAGPIRAGSLAVRTVKGLSQGAGKDALSQAGAKAITDRPIRNAIGKSLTGASDNMAVRAVGATPSQLTNFQKNFGEDITSTLSRNKLTGKELDDVTNFRVGLNDKFDQLVSSAGAVSKKDLQSALKSVYSPLLKDVTSDTRKLGQSIKLEADNVLKQIKTGTIPASELNKFRRSFDDLVNYKNLSANPVRYDVNKALADSLRSTVQQAPGANGLKETGMEISKIRALEDILQAQGNRGRGSNPIGITDMLGGGIGGTMAALPGAVAGMATMKAVNSGAAKRLGTKTLSSAGQKLSGQGKGLTVDNTAARVGIAGALSSAVQSPEGNELSTNPMMPTTMTTPMSSNMDALYQEAQDMSMAEPSIGGYTKSQIESAMVQAATEGNSKAYSQLENIYALLPQAEDAFAGLSQTSRSSLASSDNAAATLDQLQQLYQNSGGARGRFDGWVGNIAADLGQDSNVSAYNKLAQSSVTQLAKALAGAGSGTVSDMDAKVIIEGLPRVNDTPEEAAIKFKTLRDRLEIARQNTLLYGGGQEQQQQQAAF